MDKILAKIETYLILLLVFLVPLFVFSLAPNPFIIPKLVVLTFGVALVLLLKAIRVLIGGSLKLAFGSFDFAVLLILTAYLLSSIFRTPNKMEAFLFPGTATAVVASGLLYFLINQLDKKEKNNVKLALLGSGLVFGFITLVSSMGILSKITFLPALLLGMTQLDIPHAVAPSAYWATVDADLCNGCAACVDRCQVDAIKMGDEGIAEIDVERCLGCGVCTFVCAPDALRLSLRDNRVFTPALDPHEYFVMLGDARGRPQTPHHHPHS